MQVQETMPGAWLVDNVAVLYYPGDWWGCGACHRTWIYAESGPTPCAHIAAVLEWDDVTECQNPEADCVGIACESVRIDGVPTPLCPEHITRLRKVNS